MPSPLKFKPIIPGGHWSYLSTLDGTPLKEGELLTIQFPDDAILLGVVSFRVTLVDPLDHVYEYFAYTNQELHGHPVQVPLQGLNAFRGTY